jgi:hypothetical protein
MSRMGLREYSRHRGCALSAVQKAVATGRIERDADGRIDSDAADAAWAAHTDRAKQRKDPPAAVTAPDGPLLGGEPLPAPPMRALDWPELPGWAPQPLNGPQAVVVGKIVDGESFMAAKTRREWAEAQRAEAKLAEEQGRLIPADGAQKLFRDIGRAYASVRENLASEIAPQVIGLTDPREIERRIRAVLRETDTRVANEIEAKYAAVVHGNVERCASQ